MPAVVESISTASQLLQLSRAESAAVLAQGFGLLSMASILAMLVVTSVNVFGRYFLGAPLRGAEELTGFLVIAAVMFGAAEAHRRGEHIAIDVVEGAFPPALRRVMTVVGHLAVIVFAVAMAWTLEQHRPLRGTGRRRSCRGSCLRRRRRRAGRRCAPPRAPTPTARAAAPRPPHSP